MLNRFKKQLVQLGVTINDKILVAISGGVDSMVLSNLLLRSGLTHSVAHIDHHTREGQSTEDRYFVEKYANTNNLPFHIHNLVSKEASGNFHDWAHKERYRFFTTLGYDKVLTAHHYDDEVETIFINFLNGRSIESIPEINGVVLRPLLQFTKAEILAYAKELNIGYREDSSNQKNKYLRNLIRNQIIPDLTKVIDENVGSRLNALAKRTREDQQLLKSLIEDKVVSEKQNGRLRLSIPQLQAHPPTFLYHVIREYGFGRDICEQIHTALPHKGATFYSENKMCVVADGYLIIDSLPQSWQPLEVDKRQLPLSVIINNHRFTLSIEDTASRLHDKHACTVPMLLLSESIIIRAWQEGDQIKPYGMAGKTKKLKKVFADKKIDIFQKHSLPIFTSNEEVIWITSLMSSDTFSVDKEGPFLQIVRITSL